MEKRKRIKRNYKDDSTSSFSSEESDEGNITRANEWKHNLTKLMHISITTESMFDQREIIESEEDMYLLCVSDDMWEAKAIDIKSLPLNPTLKTLVREVKDVYDAKARLYETYINDYVDTLLHNLQFHSYPLHINAQRRYEIKIGNNEATIVAIPDFVVTSYESKMMIIVEDKTMKNATYANGWKEDQVMAEIFVAAHNLKITQQQDIYAVRIIGTLFTFYKATVSNEYIKETLRGFPTKEHMAVKRYPDPGDDVYEINALDFCKIEQRREIIDYLCHIKQRLQL